MSIKVIATDLDGTLIGNDGRVSTENLEAISELQRLGVTVVPISGRAKGEFPRELLNHQATRYIITSSGAVLEDLKTGERVENCITGELAVMTGEILRKYDLLSAPHVDGEAYIPASVELTEEFGRKYSIYEAYRALFLDTAKAIEDITGLFDGTHSIEMLPLFYQSKDDKLACESELRALGLSVSYSDPRNSEILNDGVSKGNMLGVLIDRLGISGSEIITVGDSFNDASMMVITPNSYAVENASAELKKLAKYSAPGNTEHIMKFFLELLRA